MTEPTVAPVMFDEEYKTAIQPVIDNNMRTDILGPHFCKVLENHTPASKAIILIISQAICADPDIKKSVRDVIDEHNKESKIQWINRLFGAAGTVILALIIWAIESFIKK